MRTLSACRRVLVAAVSVAWFTLSAAAGAAWADQVSGTVTRDGRPVTNGTLVVRAAQKKDGGIEVPTTDKGSYRVFLEPGQYQVSLKDRPADVLPLESLPAPVTRDLAFGKR